MLFRAKDWFQLPFSAFFLVFPLGLPPVSISETPEPSAVCARVTAAVFCWSLFIICSLQPQAGLVVGHLCLPLSHFAAGRGPAGAGAAGQVGGVSSFGDNPLPEQGLNQAACVSQGQGEHFGNATLIAFKPL